MIISHKYKFIFIKTQKTAGTSIEVFLSRLCGKDDTVTPVYPYEKNHVARNHLGLFNPLSELNQYPLFKKNRITCISVLTQFLRLRKYYNHMSAVSVRNRIGGEIWDSYYKFCFERNPWDKTLSHFNMMKQRGNIKCLDDYFTKGVFPHDWQRYSDKNDKILVDKIFKYENLNEELKYISEKLNIPFAGKLAIFSKTGNKKKPYRDYYSDEKIKIIEDNFKNEIELLNYTY